MSLVLSGGKIVKSGGKLYNTSTTVAADWLARSTQAGVIYATDFSNAGVDFAAPTHVFGADDSGSGGPGSAYWKALVSQQTGDPRLPYKMRITSPALLNAAQGAAWYTSMNPGGFPGTATLGGAWTTKAQGIGNTPFYVSFRLKIPASRLIGTDRVAIGSQGVKYVDCSCYDIADPQNQSQSNVTCEIIGQQYWQFGFSPWAYHQDGSGYPPFGQVSTGPPINDIVETDQDNGAGAGSNNNRYCLYNSGAGSAGCYQLAADTWYAFKLYVNPVTYNGSTGNQFGMWIAAQDTSSWVQIYDPAKQINFTIGQGSAGFLNGYSGLWLNAYETGLSGTPTTNTYQEWGQTIISLADIALPAVGA